MDAYLVASAVIGFGSAAKAIGVITAAVLALASLFYANDLVAIAGVLSAAVLVGFYWIIGVVVTALGQLLRATLDTAVNGSPFLDREQQARVMGIHAG